MDRSSHFWSIIVRELMKSIYHQLRSFSPLLLTVCLAAVVIIISSQLTWYARMSYFVPFPSCTVYLIKCVIAPLLLLPLLLQRFNQYLWAHKPAFFVYVQYNFSPEGVVGGKKVQFKDVNSPPSTINSWENGEMTLENGWKLLAAVVKETDDMSSLWRGRGCSNPSLTLRILICCMCIV